MLKVILSCLVGLCLLILIFLLYQTLIYPLYLSPLRHLPGPPLFIAPSSKDPVSYLVALIQGQFPAIAQGEAGVPQREWLKKYGGSGGVVRVVGPLGLEVVVFVGFAAWQKVLVSECADYPRPQFFRDILGLLGGQPGLLTLEGAKHKQLKKMIRPAFALPEIVSRMNGIYEVAESLCDAILNQVATEGTHLSSLLPMQEWMMRATIDLVCATALSWRSNTLHDRNHPLAVAFRNLSEAENIPTFSKAMGLLRVIPGFGMFVRSKLIWKSRRWSPYFFPLINIHDFHLTFHNMYNIRGIANQILQERIRGDSVQTKDEQETRDIIDVLLSSNIGKEAESTLISNVDIAEQIVMVLNAGTETTMSGLCWILYLLAKSKNVQNRLRREVVPVLARWSRPDHGTLKSLRWLHYVIMEGLRVLPPAPRTFRQALKTDYIDGVLIPRGTILYVPIRAVNTWEPFWGPDAEEFRPERWLHIENKTEKQDMFMTFIMGPHGCLGKGMALLELKVMIATLISRFEFDLAHEGQIVQSSFGIGFIPTDGLPLRVRYIGGE